jgi:PAS domain S-box-containing protein
MYSPLVNLFLAQSRESAFITLNAEGRIVDWLPGATSIFGYEPREVIGSTLDFLFMPDDRARKEPEHELEVARVHGHADDTRWHLRKDQTPIWADGMLTAVRDKQQELIGYIKLLRDRTQLRSQLDTLENRNKCLLERDQKVSVFIGTLAHELRNMLAPMNNAAQLLQMALEDNPSTNVPLNMIGRQLKSVEHLVQELLDITRFGVAKAGLDYEQCELGRVVDGAIEACQCFLEQHRQRVSVAISSPITIEADVVRLRQVLVNLLSNASKFSGEGSPILIKCSIEGHEAVVRVRDRGRGIPLDLLPVIFESFTQAEKEGRNGAGLGLGLAIVKSIVEKHHGSVQARSGGINRGAEFIVRLPLKQGLERTFPTVSSSHVV